MLLNRHNLEIAKYADSESRYTVKGVNVSPDGTTVINGHYAIRVSLPTQPQLTGEEAKPFTVAADDALKVSKALPKVKKNAEPPITSVTVTDDSILCSGALPVDMTVAVIPDNFPDIERVMPQDKPKLTIGLSAEYLALLAKSAMETVGKDATIKLEFTGDMNVVKMTATNTSTEQTWTALLMPVRLGEE